MQQSGGIITSTGHDTPLCLTSLPQTIPPVDKSSMKVEQQDLQTQSLK